MFHRRKTDIMLCLSYCNTTVHTKVYYVTAVCGQTKARTVADILRLCVDKHVNNLGPKYRVFQNG